MWTVKTDSPLVASQTLMALPAYAAAIDLPLGLYATPLTVPRCASNERMSSALSSALARSQTLMVPSKLPPAICLPSGRKATDNTRFLGPLSVAITLESCANSGDDTQPAHPMP